jgi:hypothetical protein
MHHLAEERSAFATLGEAAPLDRIFPGTACINGLPLGKTSGEPICGFKDSFEEGDTPFPEKPPLVLESSE